MDWFSFLPLLFLVGVVFIVFYLAKKQEKSALLAFARNGRLQRASQLT